MTEKTGIEDENPSASATGLPPSSWPRNLSLVVGAVMVAALSVAPFFVHITSTASGRAVTLGVLSTHDLKEHVAVMEQFDKSLRSGVLYPRWLADVNGEYGNAWTNFYPPVCYYLSSAIHAVVGDWIATIAVLSVLAMAGSGITLYVLSRTFYSKRASVIAAVLYVLLPYHVLDLYWRGALPELLGFVFLPLLIYFAFRLGDGRRLIDFTGFGLTYGLYVMTHLPVGYLMSYVLVIYAIVWSLRERNGAILLRIGCGMVLGLLVCAIYLVPAVLEARHAHEETSMIFPYDGSYLPALPPHDSFGNILNHSFMFQAIMLAGAMIVIRSMLRMKSKSKSTPQLALWMVLGVWATFMVTAPSFYVAKLIPRTDLVAFPWRWLAISGMFTAVLVAAAIDRLSGDAVVRSQRWAYRALILIVMSLNLWFTAQRVIVASLRNIQTTGSSGLVEASYTPKGATLPQNLPDTPRILIDPEGGVVEVVRWSPQSREAVVKVEEISRVRLKTYNFPGWTARVDGSIVPMLSDKDGIQQVEVPAGIHVVRATFENTPPRTAGTLLSGVGVLLILGLSLAGRLRQPRTESDEVTESAARERPSESVIASAAKGNKIIPLKTLGVIAAVVIVVIGAAIVVTTTRRSGPGNTHSPADKAVVPGSLAPSSETHLYLAGQDSIIVAVDEKALDQVLTALSGRDKPALDALVDSGRALKVANNTAVRVLETGTGKTKVRVIEGEHMMVDGWVPERWLR